jgi:peptidoglycan/xylan/chitin deacetylase (PgdA/CDA1 family)
VTVFLTTGFLDGALWFWWDHIDHILASTRVGQLRLRVREGEWTCDVRDDRRREAFVWALREHAQRVPDAERIALLAGLADAADVAPPASAPAMYAAMTWPEVAALERRGVSFGPHTVTHRTLTRLADADAEREIGESWDMLRRRLARPAPILAYPYGRYGEREVRIAAARGLVGAVTTRCDYADRRSVAAVETGAFELPRFGCPDDVDGVRLVASGFERVAAGLRRWRSDGPKAEGRGAESTPPAAPALAPSAGGGGG